MSGSGAYPLQSREAWSPRGTRRSRTGQRWLRGAVALVGVLTLVAVFVRPDLVLALAVALALLYLWFVLAYVRPWVFPVRSASRSASGSARSGEDDVVMERMVERASLRACMHVLGFLSIIGLAIGAWYDSAHLVVIGAIVVGAYMLLVGGPVWAAIAIEHQGDPPDPVDADRN